MGFILIKVGFNMKNILVRILLIIASMGIMTLPQAETTPKLKLMTEIYPPFQNKNEERMFGISIDIVKAIQKSINNSDEIKIYPWPRGVKILNSKPNSALFSMVRTTERESLYKWVGPITSTQMVFYKKKEPTLLLIVLKMQKRSQRLESQEMLPTMMYWLPTALPI
jgi:polar amino acid transport system substrate-binding protein